MNTKTIYSLVVIIAILIVGVSLLGKKAPNPTSGEPVKIGAVLSFTSFAAPWGESAKKGIDLAVKMINKDGGIDGRPVEVIYEDDQTDGKTAVTAYNKLVKVDKVSGIIGSVFDFNTQPLLPLAESDKIALITPSNFRIDGGFELGEHSFTMLINFDDMIRSYTEFLGQDKIKKLAVVHYTSTWGVEITKTIAEIMASYGKAKPIEEVYTQLGGNDFRTTILKLKAADVDTVFLDTLDEDTVNFLKRSKELGFKPTFITYTGALEVFNNQQDKSLIEGVSLVNWEISSPEFNKLYKDAYGVLPDKSADKAFDALYVMAHAIAASPDASAVATYIANNSFKTPNTTVRFISDHTVASTSIEIQTVVGGKLAPWQR